MDKIDKLLSKIPSKDALAIASTLEKIIKGHESVLDIKKLKGQTSIFRVRIGKYRIIFEKQAKAVNVLEISRRKEDTYRNF